MKPASPSGNVPIPKIRRGFRQFMTDILREMKKVNWPTKSETNRLTGIVLAVCTMLILVLTGMSFVIATGLDLLLKKG